MKSVSEIEEQRASDASFRNEFAAISEQLRQKLEGADKEGARFACQSVMKLRHIGIRVEYEVALVEEAAFSKEYGVPAETVPGVSVISVPGLDGKPLVGALLQCHQVPPQLPHYRLKVYSDQASELVTCTVDGKELLREGQAIDSWSANNRGMMTARPEPLKGMGLANILSHKAVKEKVEALEAAKKERLRQLELGNDMGAVETEGAVRTASRFGAGDDGFGAMPAPIVTKRARKKTAGIPLPPRLQSAAGTSTTRGTVAPPSKCSAASGSGAQRSSASSLVMSMGASRSPGKPEVGASSSSKDDHIDIPAMMHGSALGRELKGVGGPSRCERVRLAPCLRKFHASQV